MKAHLQIVGWHHYQGGGERQKTAVDGDDYGVLSRGRGGKEEVRVSVIKITVNHNINKKTKLKHYNKI